MRGGGRMIRKTIIASALFLSAAGVAIAYYGSHNFSNVATTTSDGHSYTSEYLATGTFPYNGTGANDGSKVNLTGIFTVHSVDGVTLTTPEQYCVKTTGSINSSGRGKLTAKVYDVSCNVLQETKTLTVKKYTEDAGGNFTLLAVDNYGVTSTSTGGHGR